MTISCGLWCVAPSRSLRLFWRASAVRNWLLVHLMGILGFGGVLLYGLGASAQGHPPKDTSWALYMTFFILSGNSLGLLTHEWRGCTRRTYVELSGGIAMLLAAIGCLANS